ncbi:MAG TPA: DUF692 domain-containing protein [Polyangiaceae bacterium]|jgi:hypothetical protein
MNFRARHGIRDLGVGVGFRPKHAREILDAGRGTEVDWFEVVSENYMVDGGRPMSDLAKLRERFAVVPHGVCMSIGAVEKLDDDYLARLKKVVRALDPPYFTDHVCFCKARGLDLHDLLPLPYTDEAIEHLVPRIRYVQNTIEKPFALENVSSYLTYRSSQMPEHEFIAELAERADCGILLDVNNVYVSAFNHGFDAEAFIDGIPADRVVQIHLAGHTDKGSYLLDTHSDHVKEEVWALYRRAIRRIGPVSTLVEWDDQIPTWDVLAQEAKLAREHRDEAAR